MSALDRLGERLAREQDKIVAACGFVDQAKEQLSFDPASYRQRRRRALPLAACLAAAAAVVLIYMAVPRSVTVAVDGQELPEGAWVSAGHDQPAQLAFSDGSTIRLGSDSSLRVQQLRPDGAHLLLERGRLEAAVAHRSDTRWALDVGPYLVTVTGTQFDARWDAKSRELRLTMREGSVRVAGPMVPSGTTLVAGERLVASLAERRLEISAGQEARALAGAPSPASPVAAPPERPLETGEPDGPSSASVDPAEAGVSANQGSVPRPNPAWATLLKRGAFKQALEQAKASGLEPIIKTAPAAKILTLADTARHTGDQKTAVALYKAVRRRFPATGNASEAAFALGKMAFDTRRSYKAAARWFRACLADDRDGVLSKEAMGRLLEALRRSGDENSAQTTAAEYLRRFPNGPHADAARALAARAEAR